MMKRTNNRLTAAARLSPMEIPSATNPTNFDPTTMWEVLSPLPPNSAPATFEGLSALSPYAGPPSGADSNIRRKLRKTRVCKHFLRGRCHYGANCTFAHYDSELYKKPNLAKTKLCAKPNCSDPECTYAHSVEELRQPGEASDMDTARVDIEHEKVLGEQRALLTVHNLMATVADPAGSPGILPSPSILPNPMQQQQFGVSPNGGGQQQQQHGRYGGSRGGINRSTLHALAVKNEELQRQVEMSNTVLAHLLQVASAQAVPETPYVVPSSNVFSQATAAAQPEEGGGEEYGSRNWDINVVETPNSGCELTSVDEEHVTSVDEDEALSHWLATVTLEESGDTHEEGGDTHVNNHNAGTGSGGQYEDENGTFIYGR
ncbi:hypothetical protein FOL47_009811 [Perkinsus chesapeaki]|uniref:C3H1-type domain-containing protein n=1 Tax=Perkinsus chesapeaki TaxID=330153 RepID=A0A7J6MS19_PERCH|nr:hypothetical protein FOL47_009811 [Perkinsus chesapeaki]